MDDHLNRFARIDHHDQTGPAAPGWEVGGAGGRGEVCIIFPWESRGYRESWGTPLIKMQIAVNEKRFLENNTFD